MLLTAIILLFIIFTFVWRSKVCLHAGLWTGNAFDKQNTHFIKGLSALIVVMVHFPADKVNPLQDGIGSFAYIAVTFFFFVSAYGMQYSIEKYHRALKYIPSYIRDLIA